MKILVIDDENEILNAVENILTREGYEITKADNLKDAKSLVSEGGFDLLISDIMLPYWGGFDLVDLVKEDPDKNKIPVIVITGMDKDILESTNTYADACLTKPFTGKQLLETVSNLLNKTATEEIK
jgi:DNA-binding response OmpR family regulator